MDNRSSRSATQHQIPVNGSTPYYGASNGTHVQATQPRLASSLTQPVVGAQSHVSPTATFQRPGALSPAADSELRQTIVSLLSSAANGCLAEMGYNDLFQRCAVLERENQALKQQVQSLQKQLSQAQALFNHASSTEVTARVQVENLKERIRNLERTQAPRQKADAVIQATDHATSLLSLQYAELKRKYHQALVTLATHQVLHNLEPSHVQDQIAKANETSTSSSRSLGISHPTHSASTTSTSMPLHMGRSHLQQRPSSSSNAPHANSPTVADEYTLSSRQSQKGTIVKETTPLNGASGENSGSRPVVDSQWKKQDAPRPTSSDGSSFSRDVHTASPHSSSSKPPNGDNDTRAQTKEAVDGDVDMADNADEEEDCSDLTDDESGTKQTLLECVSAVFFDDTDDERYCRLCNNRIEMGKTDSRRKPTFSEHSMRELVMHLKDEHPQAWVCLRNEGRDGNSLSGSRSF